MYRIEVYYSFIKVLGYCPGDCQKLENYFRIYDNVTHTGHFEHIIFDTKNRILYLPRGMDIFFLETVLSCKANYIRDPDPFFYNETIMLRYKPKDEKQRTTLKFILGKDEFRNYQTSSQNLVSLTMGGGKTYVSTAFFAISGLKPMVICYGIEAQWRSRLKEYTDLKDREIYTIKGMDSVRILMRHPAEVLAKKYKVYIATHGTLLSLFDTGMENLHKLFLHLGIGVKVIDEAHRNFMNTCKIDYSTNTLKTIYLTATPALGDVKKNKIFGLYFKNVPKIDLFDESDKHTKYIALRYSSNPSLMEINNCMTNRGFNIISYADYVVKKPNFYHMLDIVFDFMAKLPGKKLLYMASNNAILTVYNYIMNDFKYRYYVNSIGIYTSINPNKQAALDKEIIFTTSKSAGEALDIHGLICAVNLADPTKSEPLVEQRFGRVRINGYYIDLIDEGFLNTIRFYHSNLKIYNRFATECKEALYDNQKLIAGSRKFVVNHPLRMEDMFRRREN